jgi:hypothetical protein
MDSDNQLKYLTQRIAYGEQVMSLLISRGWHEDIDKVSQQLLDLRRSHEDFSYIHTTSKSLVVEDGKLGLRPVVSLDAQVEIIKTINDKFGITDRDHRLYNVLVWVLGYYQDRGENRGEWYEALEQEQQRLRRILEARGVG